MTAFSLTLDRVTCTLPDGRVLFSDIGTHIEIGRASCRERVF